jgi:hypothetical protein
MEMMRNTGQAAVWALCGFLLALACGGEGKSPVSPPVEPETFTVEGNVYFSTSLSPREVTIHLRGEGVEKTVTAGVNGTFRVPGLARGKYVVYAEENGFIPFPDSLEFVLPEGWRSANLGAFAPADYEELRNPETCAILGRVTTEDGRPVNFTTVATGITNQAGCFQVFANRGETLLLAPRKKGYEYSFSPDSLTVTANSRVLFADFTARYSGLPLHTVSGQVFPVENGVPVTVSLTEKFTLVASTSTDSTGAFVLSDLKDGSYMVKYELPDYVFSSNNFRTVVKGADVLLPITYPQYTGSESFALSGKVLSEEGKAMSGVSVDIHTAGGPGTATIRTTDAGGEFTFQASPLKRYASQTYIIQPVREAARFSPDSVKITLKWNGARDGGTVSVPDFLCRDFSGITASAYFPLRVGASWTYDRAAPGDSPREYTVRVSGKSVVNGKEFLRSSAPGPAGYTDFCVEGNSVLALYRAQSIDILRFMVLPGTTWDIDRVYPSTGTFLGLDTVTVPAGAWTECAKFELRTVYGETSYEVHTLWFAKGVGMVRSEYTLVNYGETREAVTLALKSWN